LSRWEKASDDICVVIWLCMMAQKSGGSLMGSRRRERAS
jgi:hypothetical protein